MTSHLVATYCLAVLRLPQYGPVCLKTLAREAVASAALASQVPSGRVERRVAAPLPPWQHTLLRERGFPPPRTSARAAQPRPWLPLPRSVRLLPLHPSVSRSHLQKAGSSHARLPQYAQRRAAVLTSAMGTWRAGARMPPAMERHASVSDCIRLPCRRHEGTRGVRHTLVRHIPNSHNPCPLACSAGCSGRVPFTSTSRVPGIRKCC